MAIAVGAGALLLVLATYLLRLDQVLGQYQDDAWYTVLAKALATGRGYTLISAPAEGIGAFIYPPAYPGLLSLAWRLWPEFPQNVWLLKSISVTAMLGVTVVCYRYFRGVRETSPSVAAGIALATALNPALVFLATSTTMSECVFTLGQVLTVLMIERAVRTSRTGHVWPYLAMGGVLASLTWLTRAIGATLAMGIVLYLLKKRQLRGAVVPAVIVACLAGAWTLYASRHAATAEQRAQQDSYIVISNFGETFWQRQAGNPNAGQIGASELPARVWNNLTAIATHDIGVMVLAPLPYWEKGGEVTAEGIATSPLASILSLLLSVLVVVGFSAVVLTEVTLAEIVFALSLMIILVFPWTPFRYLLPLLPFTLFYVVMGVRSCHEWYRGWLRVPGPHATWATPAIVIGCVVALNIYSNTTYILRKYSPVQAERPEWLRIFVEHEALFRWIRDNIPADQTLISQNPPLLYLYTGLKTMPAANAALRRDVWDEHHIRYLVQMGIPRPPDPNEAEQKFETPYRSQTALNLRVVDMRQSRSR